MAKSQRQTATPFSLPMRPDKSVLHARIYTVLQKAEHHTSRKASNVWFNEQLCDVTKTLICIYYIYINNTNVYILDCPKSVFLSQTCFLPQYTFIRTWNQVCEMSTEQNWSYVIRQNNIKQKALYVYYFLIKRKKLFGQSNTWRCFRLSERLN